MPDSFAVCPLCGCTGHDGDACRAVRCSDGAIVCFACQQAYPDDMSPRTVNALRSVARLFGTPVVKLGSETTPGSSEYNAACLSGYDPALSSAVRVSFRQDNQSATLSWDRTTYAAIEAPDAQVGRRLEELDEKELAELPERIKQCVSALSAEGFRIRHISESNGYDRRIAMTCGKTIGKMGYVSGLSAELTWLA